MKLLAYGISMSLDYGQRLLQCHRAPQALTNTLQNYWQMLCLGIALEPANRRRSFQKKLSSGRQTIVIDSQMAIEGLAELIQRLLIIEVPVAGQEMIVKYIGHYTCIATHGAFKALQKKPEFWLLVNMPV